MRFNAVLAATTAILFATPLSARRSLQHVNKRSPAHSSPSSDNNKPAGPTGLPSYGGPPKKHIIPQSANTTKFAVDGTALPFVDWDLGESYAGLLPLSHHADAGELYFWFFPSDNPLAGDEILVWLNGGPGCSSLEGLIQENGPLQWQYGTYRPVPNPYTWVNLTNVVWVEQPIGTGFTKPNGTPKPTNEVEVADQFLGFWRNFVDTFGLHGRKVFITGESYAGMYVPYIADAMHNQTNKEYFNVEAVAINDPTISYGSVQDDIPVTAFVDYWGPLLNLNQSFVDELHQRADECGYTAFMEEAMTFPPKGPLPTPPNADDSNANCRLWYDVFQAALMVNPCFDEYQVATTCPVLWDVLGFPGSFGYEPAPWIYFNRADVQAAIHAPRDRSWAECTPGVLNDDTSPPSGLTVLPRVIEKNKRTLIGHGMLDMTLVMNGTLMAINNMTFSHGQGFSTPPSQWKEFYVPYHSRYNTGSLAGAGVFGNWHTERGLTFTTVDLSGHMIPQYQPAAAYRMTEFVLGRIAHLGERSDFTTDTGNFGN